MGRSDSRAGRLDSWWDDGSGGAEDGSAGGKADPMVLTVELHARRIDLVVVTTYMHMQRGWWWWVECKNGDGCGWRAEWVESIEDGGGGWRVALTKDGWRWRWWVEGRGGVHRSLGGR